MRYSWRFVAVLVVMLTGCNQSTSVTPIGVAITAAAVVQVTNTPNATGIAFAQVKPRLISSDWQPEAPPIYQIGAGTPPDLSGYLQTMADYVNYAGGDESRLKSALTLTPGGQARTDYTWIYQADLDFDGAMEYLVSFPEYRTPTHGGAGGIRLKTAQQNEQPGYYCEPPDFCLHLIVLFELENGVYVPKTGIGRFGELIWLDAPELIQALDLTHDRVPEVVVKGLNGNAGDEVIVGSWLAGRWSNYLELTAVGVLSITDEDRNGLGEIRTCRPGNYHDDPTLPMMTTSVYQWRDGPVTRNEWIQVDYREQIGEFKC